MIAALEEAEHCLKAIEALDEDGKLTSLARMIITVINILRNQPGFARSNLVLGYDAAAAAALRFPNPFLVQLEGSKKTIKNDINGDARAQDHQEKLSRKKTIKNDINGEALTIAYALQLFDLAENSFEFCRTNSLHFKTMEEMSKLRKQVLEMIFHQQKPFSWNHGGFKDAEHAWLLHSSKHSLQMNEEEILSQAICA